MNEPRPRTGLRITTILVSMVVGVVAVILLLLHLSVSRPLPQRHGAERPDQQRPGGIPGVQHGGQLSAGYGPGHGSWSSSPCWRARTAADELLSAFLKFRPDVVAVTSYYRRRRALLDCWSPGREPKENIFQNLSFDLDEARTSDGPYMTAPHVETIFEELLPLGGHHDRPAGRRAARPPGSPWI